MRWNPRCSSISSTATAQTTTCAELALSRRVEQQQQKRVNWLKPIDETQLETTIGYEHVAVDLTAWLAQNEPDAYAKQALDFALGGF